MILLLLYSLTSECVFSTRSVVINLGYKIESLEYLKYIYIHFVAHPEVIAILKNINNSDAQWKLRTNVPNKYQSKTTLV